MKRGPVTVRNIDAAAIAAESERLLRCPTVSMRRETIDALLEADADRAQSERDLVCAEASLVEEEAK